ncbi:MAG: UDP-2,3-diacylglucosamine diphosphatase [Ottowia sp.]|nr:UDP-2,3-diacylglucosamine diphosphatase [Ottowia sp.]
MGTSHLKLTGQGPLFFISDLHLSEQLPQTCAAFCTFLNHTAPQAQALFILGDLFEYWIGDDCLSAHEPWLDHIVAQLSVLKAKGVALYILSGNRDFLLGKRFAHAVEATLLNDICLLQAFAYTIVLAHGDTLCIHDHSYQQYRRWVHKAWLQQSFLALPLSWRQRLAKHLHRYSQAQHQSTRSIHTKKDVDTYAAQALLNQAQAQILIHGHTHQPYCHTLPNGKRWVLSDWDMDHAQRGSYLRLDKQGITQVAYLPGASEK